MQSPSGSDKELILSLRVEDDSYLVSSGQKTADSLFDQGISRSISSAHGGSRSFIHSRLPSLTLANCTGDDTGIGEFYSFRCQEQIIKGRLAGSVAAG